MSIRFEERPQMIVTSFSDELGGLSIRQLEKTLAGLDLKDTEQVTKEVKRCNDRCNGNKVDVALKVKQFDPEMGLQVRDVNLKFIV